MEPIIKKWLGKDIPYVKLPDEMLSRFKKNKIHYKLDRNEAHEKKKLIFYHNVLNNGFSKYCEKNKILVIAKNVPRHRDLILNLHENVVVICLDKHSYDYCISCCRNSKMTRNFHLCSICQIN